VDWDEDAVPEYEGGVADPGDQVLDLAEGRQTPEVLGKTGDLIFPEKKLCYVRLS
jgi:hypothetical protein